MPVINQYTLVVFCLVPQNSTMMFSDVNKDLLILRIIINFSNPEDKENNNLILGLSDSTAHAKSHCFEPRLLKVKGL